MNPPLKIVSQPIDLELCELLGEKPSDFIMLCFDGVALQDYGTPYDTQNNRIARQILVDGLNDRSVKSLWPEMWKNWKPTICKQFGLAETTTSDAFRPVVSIEIHRVCPGRSEYLHSAITLFEKLADKIEAWSVTKGVDCLVSVTDKQQRRFVGVGDKMSLAIVQAVIALLKANQCPPPAAPSSARGGLTT